MTKRILVFLVAVFVIFGLPLFAGGAEEEGTAEEMTVVGQDEPQYGGTLYVWRSKSEQDPENPDPTSSQNNAREWLEYIQERPIIGDIEKYGPRGTGEFRFQVKAYMPLKYSKGLLLESWEISHEKVVWHVRPGIYWQGTNGVKKVMESRELTAEDIAEDINVFWKGSQGKKFNSMLSKVYASDRYTVVIEFKNFSPDFMYYCGTEDRALIGPIELSNGTIDAEMWENQVGTGPYMFEEYVAGSYMSYVKNPDYRLTTTIKGKEYKIPFIDRVVRPIIPDLSTQMAALRTGKLDFHADVPNSQFDALQKTTPGLKYVHYSSVGLAINLDCGKPPFDNVAVRKAMMIGTDMAAFRKLDHAEDTVINWYPLHPDYPELYIPLEKLPEDCQQLYTYNPELAKKMLADAGYPDGFKVNYHTMSTPSWKLEYSALIKNAWEKIGVEVDIQVYDAARFNKVTSDPDSRNGAAWHGGGIGMEYTYPFNTLSRLATTNSQNNYSGFSDPKYDQLILNIGMELDADKANSMMQEAAIYLLRQVAYIPTNASKQGYYWWPWLKNYYGELSLADNSFTGNIQSYMWIDQEMKKEMGY